MKRLFAYLRTYGPAHTSVYSPAHALWWAVAGSMGMSAFMSWIVTAVLMALFSVQVGRSLTYNTELVPCARIPCVGARSTSAFGRDAARVR